MATAVSKEEILKMNELYKELKTYSAVARAVGRTPGTVKRYIVDDFVPQDEIVIVSFDESLICDVPDLSGYSDNFGVLCEIWSEERDDYEALHSEINI